MFRNLFGKTIGVIQGDTRSLDYSSFSGWLRLAGLGAAVAFDWLEERVSL